jgi:hypothetical protein
MRARLVTGYVPLADHPRSAEEYGVLGEKLGGVPVRKAAFYQRVEETWLHRFVKHLQVIPRVSAGDNPQKNTLAYHCVNHQKTEWLLAAVEKYPEDDVYVWVDYGIFHQPGITNEVIYNFMERVQNDAIYAPGCYDKPVAVISAAPCWRFCGSVLAVPKMFVPMLHYACVRTAQQHIRSTNNVEWEINTIARVEKNERLPFHWYRADHNATQFTNLPHTSEQAGAGETALREI